MPIKTLRLGIKSLWRKLHVPRIDRDLEILVISPGGVGTTFLIEYISQFKNTNDAYDRDGLKHLPWPPRNLRHLSNCRILFITGPEDDIVLSLKRRGWVRIQSARLASTGGVFLKDSASEAAFRRSIRKQMQCWKTLDAEKMMIVNYENLWDAQEEIASFCDIPVVPFVARFPKKQPRQSRPLPSPKAHGQ